jgi:hypothetical protein
MQKRVLFAVGFMIILIFASGVTLGIDSNFCPIILDGNKTAVDSPEAKILAPEKNYSVPRNQVLLEIATATW